MKMPCCMDVPDERVVRTFNSPGNSPMTTAAAAMAPAICVKIIKKPLIHGTAPIRHIPNVTYMYQLRKTVFAWTCSNTAGLKRPPLIRKNVHAFTANEKPKARLM